MTDDRYLISPPPEPQKTQPDQHRKERQRTNIAIGIALLAAIFTGWQGYEARQARIDAKNASVQQAEDVERARKAAEESAKAAMLLAEVGKQSLSITERGSIAAERSVRTAEENAKSTKQLFAEGRRAEMSRVATVMQQFEADKPIKYEVQFWNTGRSRAVNVTTLTHPIALGSDQAFPSEPTYNTQELPSTSVVLPGENIWQHGEGDLVIPRSLVENVNSRKVRVYVHGKITYDDTDGKHHTTTFCDYYVPGKETLVACSVYNAAN